MKALTVPAGAVATIVASLTVANIGMKLFQASLVTCVPVGC